MANIEKAFDSILTLYKSFVRVEKDPENFFRKMVEKSKETHVFNPSNTDYYKVSSCASVNLAHRVDLLGVRLFVKATRGAVVRGRVEQ